MGEGDGASILFMQFWFCSLYDSNFQKVWISLLSKSLNYLSDFTWERRKIKKNHAKMSFILLNFPFLQNMYVCTYVLKLQKQISLQSILIIDTV